MAALRNTDLNLARLRGETNITASGAACLGRQHRRRHRQRLMINKRTRRSGHDSRPRNAPVIIPVRPDDRACGRGVAVGGRLDPVAACPPLGSRPSAGSGRRHGLRSVLLLGLQAVKAGASSWVALAQWAATAPQALAVCGTPPSASTFRRVLAASQPWRRR